MFCKLSNKVYNCSVSVVRCYAELPPSIKGYVGGRFFAPIKTYDPEEAPEDMPSFEERMAERNKEDPDLSAVSDIGAPYVVPEDEVAKQKIARENRRNAELERASRHQTLIVPLAEVRQHWSSEFGPVHKKSIADHYGVYKDLFNGSCFTPVINMKITFDYDENTVTPVYYGNRISPLEASCQPSVEYDTEDQQSLWTLLLTNPDGHLSETNAEYLHWMVGNIPGSDISRGETLCDYMQPFPPRGSGFHRHVFLLYRQTERIDYSTEKLPSKCKSLQERTFRNEDFFRKHQAQLTPVGLNFFQSDWDASVKDVYHRVLDMREPAFEYAFPPHYISILKKYPHKQPFDRYFDRYREKQDIAEEVLKMKLQMISPFKEYKQPYKYPIVHLDPKRKLPTWLRNRRINEVLRKEQFKDLP